MNIEKYKLEEHNQLLLKEHQRKFDFISSADSIILFKFAFHKLTYYLEKSIQG